MDRFGTRNRRDHVTSRLRLRGYDYSSPGYYFITICCENRTRFLGDVRDNAIILNEPGEMVHRTWTDLPGELRGITIDSFVTMPNHVHALVGVGVRLTDPDKRSSLIDIVHWYKSLTTTFYIKGVRESGWPRFDGRLWQDRFHDHIVRNEQELDVIRNYIATNPERWEEDTFYSE